MWKDEVRVCLLFLMSCYLTTDLIVSRRSCEEEKVQDIASGSTSMDVSSPPSGPPSSGALEALLEGPLEASDSRLVSWIVQTLSPPSSSPYDLSLGRNVDFTKLPYWQRVHRGILDLLEGKRDGFFLEAGALDGYYQSNTFFLERDFNWTGLLVEPNPVLYQRLKRRHRRAWSTDLCLGTRDYAFKTKFWVYTGSDPMQGLIAASRSSLLDEYLKNYGKEGLSSGTVVQVQCVPAYSLLLALNVTTIDLFSLDVENAEVSVIESFPFSKVHVEVLVVEHWTQSGRQDVSDFIRLVEGKGFVYYRRDNHDFFFLNKFPRWITARPKDKGAKDNTEPYEVLMLPGQ